MFYLVYPSLPLLSFPISPSHQRPIRKDNIGVQILWRGKHVMRKIRSRLKGLKCNSLSPRVLLFASVALSLSLANTRSYTRLLLICCVSFVPHEHTLTVTPGSPPCLATVSFRESQFSKHWYNDGSNSILEVWGSSSWAWVSLLLTTWENNTSSRVQCDLTAEISG